MEAMDEVMTIREVEGEAGALSAWLGDESGVTAIEYGLLAALIAIGILAGLSATGASVTDVYIYWTTKVNQALNG